MQQQKQKNCNVSIFCLCQQLLEWGRGNIIFFKNQNYIVNSTLSKIVVAVYMYIFDSKAFCAPIAKYTRLQLYVIIEIY